MFSIRTYIATYLAYSEEKFDKWVEQAQKIIIMMWMVLFWQIMYDLITHQVFPILVLSYM